MLLRSTSSPILTSLVRGSLCHDEKIRGVILENESPKRSRSCKVVTFSFNVVSPANQLIRDSDDTRSLDGGDWDFDADLVPAPSFRKVQSETDLHALGAYFSAAGSLTNSPVREGKSSGVGDGEAWFSTGSRQWSRRMSLRRQSSLSVISSRIESGLELDSFAFGPLVEATESVYSKGFGKLEANASSPGNICRLEHRKEEHNSGSECLCRTHDYSSPVHDQSLSSPVRESLIVSAGAEAEFRFVSKGLHDIGAVYKHGQCNDRRDPSTSTQEIASVSGRQDEGYPNVLDGAVYITTASKGANGTRMNGISQEYKFGTPSDGVSSMLKAGCLEVGAGGGGGRKYTPKAGTGGGGGGHRDSSGTDTFYRRALEADPGHPLLLRNYARFLHEVRKDSVKAEEYYERAILANPGDGELLGQYAKFIWDVYADEERAGNYFDQALQASPDDCYVVAAYASFLWQSEANDEDQQVEANHSNGHVASFASLYNSSVVAHAASG